MTAADELTHIANTTAGSPPTSEIINNVFRWPELTIGRSFMAAAVHFTKVKNAAKGSNSMRKAIIFLGILSVAVHLILIFFGKATEFSDRRMLLLGIAFVGWGALPFIVLVIAGKYLRMPRLILVLGIVALVALCQLFWDVYASPTSSTSAIGLATGPVILSILFLFVLGLCAIALSFRSVGK